VRSRRDKLRSGDINVDENPVTAGKYRIMAIPTLSWINFPI
jgi:hypothetical protein